MRTGKRIVRVYPGSQVNEQLTGHLSVLYNAKGCCRATTKSTFLTVRTVITILDEAEQVWQT